MSCLPDRHGVLNGPWIWVPGFCDSNDRWRPESRSFGGLGLERVDQGLVYQPNFCQTL